MLNQLLKRQVIYASVQLGLIGVAIIGALSFLADTAYPGIVIMSGSCIAYIVFWILGIVNAVKINNITGTSAILVVFSVITLYFAHLIVAISQKNRFNLMDESVFEQNRYNQNAPIVYNSNQSLKSIAEHKLKQAFIDGIISSSEYEKKIKELNQEKK